jgi:hypothetical protein
MPIDLRYLPAHRFPCAENILEYLYRWDKWQNRQIDHREKQRTLYSESIRIRTYRNSSILRELLLGFPQ